MQEIRFLVDENALKILSGTEIKANFDETKEALKKLVSPYTGVVVDPSTLRESKNDIARIRKVRTSIDDYRKMVKRYALAPLVAFEDKCRELGDICTEAINAMDSQVKEIERKQKYEKIASLREFFANAEKRYPEYVSFEEVFSASWENKTYPLEQCKADIMEYLGAVERDIDIIKSLGSEDEPALLLRYQEHGDLRDVMDYNRSLMDAKAAAAKAGCETETINRSEKRAPIQAPDRDGITLEEAAETAEASVKAGVSLEAASRVLEDVADQMRAGTTPDSVIPTQTVEFSFRFTGTLAEIANEECFLISNGIKNYRMIYL